MKVAMLPREHGCRHDGTVRRRHERRQSDRLMACRQVHHGARSAGRCCSTVVLTLALADGGEPLHGGALRLPDRLRPSPLALPLQTRLMDAAAGTLQTLAAASNHWAFNIANALGAWLGGLVIARGYGLPATGYVGAVLSFLGMFVSCSVPSPGSPQPGLTDGSVHRAWAFRCGNRSPSTIVRNAAPLSAAFWR